MEITSLISIFINYGGPVWLDTGFGIISCGDYLILSFTLLFGIPDTALIRLLLLLGILIVEEKAKFCKDMARATRIFEDYKNSLSCSCSHCSCC
jgi:hypothetical protein